MRHLRSTAAFGAILAAGALFAGGAVKAQQTPSLDMVTPNGSNFTWSYNLTIDPVATRMAAGSYFTIYDFNGYVAGTAFAPADWTISVANVTPPPVGVSVPDNALVPNITFTYIGPTINNGGNPFGGPDAFGADSTMQAKNNNAFFTYQNPKNPTNTRQFGGGSVVAPAGVPETSSLMLLVPGLLPLGIMLRRRVRK